MSDIELIIEKINNYFKERKPNNYFTNKLIFNAEQANRLQEALEQQQETIKAKDKEIKNLHAVINARDSEDKELFEGTHEALEGLTIRGEK